VLPRTGGVTETPCAVDWLTAPRRSSGSCRTRDRELSLPIPLTEYFWHQLAEILTRNAHSLVLRVEMASEPTLASLAEQTLQAPPVPCRLPREVLLRATPQPFDRYRRAVHRRRRTACSGPSPADFPSSIPRPHPLAWAVTDGDCGRWPPARGSVASGPTGRLLPPVGPGALDSAHRIARPRSTLTRKGGTNESRGP
jgi:hypothetical protein